MPSTDLPPREPSQRLAEKSRQRKQREQQQQEQESQTYRGNKKSSRGTGSLNGQSINRQPPADLYPGLNDLGDALEAIPMDIVRHFTLLKEIDAKCVGTTPLLGELIVEFLSLPVPSPATLQAALAASSSLGDAQSSSGTPGPDNTTAADGSVVPPANTSSTGENSINGVSEDEIASIVKREELLAQIRRLINELVPCLEEKMHVAGVAADAMARHVSRIDYDFDLICRNEIPKRIQEGPANHPAFIAETRLINEQQKGAQASRSESRREAMAAKKAAAAAAGDNSNNGNGQSGTTATVTTNSGKSGRHSTPTVGKGNSSSGPGGTGSGSGTGGGRGRGAGKGNTSGVSIAASASASLASANSNPGNYSGGVQITNPPAPKRRKGNSGTANNNSTANNITSSISSTTNDSNNPTYNAYNNYQLPNNNSNPAFNRVVVIPEQNPANHISTKNEYNEYQNPNSNSNSANQNYNDNRNPNPTNKNGNDGSYNEDYEGTNYENSESISRPGTPAGSGRRGARQRTRTVGNNASNSSTQAKEDGEPVYCYCQQVSFGEMVGCDGPDCKREWFHLPCIGLSSPPKGQWFCEECAAKYKKKGGEKH